MQSKQRLAVPRFIPPMKARLADEIPTEAGWRYEVKLDGVRAIAIKDGNSVRLFSRRPRELTADHPSIIEALRRIKTRKLVLDGEIVALDAEGRTSFQMLQNFKRDSGQPGTVFYTAFDLLHLNGRDLMEFPLRERQSALQQVIKGAPSPIRQSPFFDSQPKKLWKGVTRLGLEGIVAKRDDSVYEPDRRSGAWLKIKTQHEQEFVIGGYTAPQGSRQYFGAVLVGYWEGSTLMCASKVGTGFDTAMLKSLFNLFQGHRSTLCPFRNLPKTSGRFGQGITKAVMKQCVWLKPHLVCQVRFLEWTSDGSLRQPVFVGLREDKPSRAVVRERSR